MPKLANGVEFHPGMTVVFENGRELTANDEFGVESFDRPDGRGVAHCLTRKGSGMGTDQVARLRRLQAAIEEDIRHLQAGGDPRFCGNLPGF